MWANKAGTPDYVTDRPRPLSLSKVGWLTQSLPPALLGREAEAALQALHKLPVAQRGGAQVPNSSLPLCLAAARRQAYSSQADLRPRELLLLLLLLLAEAGGQEGPSKLCPRAVHLGHLGLLRLLGWGLVHRCMPQIKVSSKQHAILARLRTPPAGLTK